MGLQNTDDGISTITFVARLEPHDAISIVIAIMVRSQPPNTGEQ